MNILALDIATCTGWATRNSHGTINIKPKRGESEGMKPLRFKARIKELIEIEQIDLVAYERPAGMHTASVIFAAKLISIVEVICLEQGIEMANYSAKEIKKFATGNGNAGKPLMIKAAREELGYEGNDDNEADAMWLFKLVSFDLENK